MLWVKCVCPPPKFICEAQMSWCWEVGPLGGNQVRRVPPHNGRGVLVRRGRTWPSSVCPVRTSWEGGYLQPGEGPHRVPNLWPRSGTSQPPELWEMNVFLTRMSMTICYSSPNCSDEQQKQMPQPGLLLKREMKLQGITEPTFVIHLSAFAGKSQGDWRQKWEEQLPHTGQRYQRYGTALGIIWFSFYFYQSNASTCFINHIVL